MSNLFEHEEISKVPFRDLLNAAMPVIKSKVFVNIDYDELSAYATIIQCKVQRDLFEIIDEDDPGEITWDDFVLLMRNSKELRDSCINVIGRKLETAFFQYDFTPKKFDLSDYSGMPDDGMVSGAELLSTREGILLMGLFLYFAEQTHFNHLRETVRPDYTWEEYFCDLKCDNGLWMEVLTAYRNTILKLDFKENWQEVEIDFGS